MEDLILYPGVEPEVFHAEIEQAKSKEVRKIGIDVDAAYSTESVDKEKGSGVVIVEHEVIDLASESDLEEDFHAVVESMKDDKMEIQITKVEINSTDRTNSSNIQEIPRSKQNRRDQGCLLSLCRLCAIPCNDMIYIFGPTILHKNILGKIQNCLPITVKETDPLSKQVCRSCLQKLESYCHFHKAVTDAEKQLLIFYEETSGTLNKDTEMQSETASQSGGQCIEIQNADQTLEKGFDKDANETSCLNEDNEARSSRCENSSPEPPMECLDSGGASASKSTEDICDSAQNSSLSETVHLELKSDKDVTASVNCSPPSTMRQSNLQVETPLSPTIKSPSSMKKRNLNSIDLYTRLSCNGSVQDHASTGQTIKCHLCGDVFQSTKKCRTHARTHFSTNYYPCCFCNKVMTAEKEWKNHWSQHSIVYTAGSRKSGRMAQRYGCNESKKKSATEVRLRNGELDHGKCDKVLDSEAPLQQEITVPNNKHERRLGNTSGAQFSKFNSQNDGPNDFISKCKHCMRILFSKRSLEEHKKICLKNNKKFVCGICNKGYGSEVSLLRHMLTHQRKKPYSCEVCSKKFVLQHDLQIHRRVHMTKFPFKCTTCGCAYRSKGLLTQHINTRHLERELYPCSVCNKQFSTKYSRKFHMAIHTIGKPFKCDRCEAQFVYPGGLYIHKRLKHA